MDTIQLNLVERVSVVKNTIAVQGIEIESTHAISRRAGGFTSTNMTIL
jgi:hypothetical protein